MSALAVLQVSYPLAQVSEDAAGGAEQVLAALDAGLVARGHAAAVVAPEGSRVAGRLDPAPPLGPGPYERAAFIAAIEAQAARVRRSARERRLDAVHYHGLYFDRMLVHGGPPALVTLHLPPAWYGGQALSRASGVAFVCVSHAQARALPPGVPLAAVIPNGVPLRAFRPGGAKEPFALVLSRVCPEKAVHDALDAARGAGVPAVVAGEVFPYPAHRAYFEAEVRPRLDATRRYVGAVGRRAKASLLARARCVVIPSLAPETSSLVAMEALASGTPVVARRSGALPEVVEDGRTGFLVDRVEDMARAIREASRLDPAECRRTAERRFSSDAMVDRYVALYRRLAGRRRAAGRRTPDRTADGHCAAVAAPR